MSKKSAWQNWRMNDNAEEKTPNIIAAITTVANGIFGIRI